MRDQVTRSEGIWAESERIYYEKHRTKKHEYIRVMDAHILIFISTKQITPGQGVA